MPEFMQSTQGIALSVAVVIFILTAFLAGIRIVGFIFALVMMVIAAVASIVISPTSLFEKKNEDMPLQQLEHSADFKTQILHAIDEINAELTQDKESIKKISDGMQLLISQVESHKQKLQSFIEETRDRLSKGKTEQPVSEDIIQEKH